MELWDIRFDSDVSNPTCAKVIDMAACPRAGNHASFLCYQVDKDPGSRQFMFGDERTATIFLGLLGLGFRVWFRV